MKLNRYRLLLVSSHPVQYASPGFRWMAQHPRLDVQVAYCCVDPMWDPEFGLRFSWDVPLTDGYAWVQVPNWSLRPGLGRFLGLVNFGVWNLVKPGKFDAVAVFGYSYLSFWIAFLAAKSAGIPILIGSDATELQSYRGGWWWKRWFKRPVVQFIYGRLVDMVLVPSTATWRFMKQLGIPDERLGFAPYVADNEYFARQATKATRTETRKAWGIPETAFVIVYSGKLVSWKCPADVLQAFASVVRTCAGAHNSAYLVLAGDGALRRELEAQAKKLQVEQQVRFLGFVNQSGMAKVYTASDVLVLPSKHEAWGIVVNEAMACGIPAVVSDHVGAGLDLVISGETGETYRTGDVQALTAILQGMLMDREATARMGRAAQCKVRSWSYAEHLEGWINALGKLRRQKSSETDHSRQDSAP